MTMANAVMMPAAHGASHAEARVLGSIAVQRGPIGDIAVHPSRDMIAVTNDNDKSVSLLDPRVLAVGSTVPVDGEPVASAVAGSRVFVGAALSTYDVVSAIDARANVVLASLPLDQHVVDITTSRDGRLLFVGGLGSESADLSVVDVESGRTDVIGIASELGATLNTVRMAGNGRFVCVGTSHLDGGRLSLVDAAKRRVVTTVETSSPFRDVVLSEDAGLAYVLGCHPDYGGVVETIDIKHKRVVRAAWIGGCPTQFSLGADGSRLYIVDAGRVAVLCMITNEIIDAISVGAQPSSVATSSDGSQLYVADYSGMVSVFAVAPPSSFGDVIDVETVALQQMRELVPAAV